MFPLCMSSHYKTSNKNWQQNEKFKTLSYYVLIFSVSVVRPCFQISLGIICSCSAYYGLAWWLINGDKWATHNVTDLIPPKKRVCFCLQTHSWQFVLNLPEPSLEFLSISHSLSTSISLSFPILLSQTFYKPGEPSVLVLFINHCNLLCIPILPL